MFQWIKNGTVHMWEMNQWERYARGKKNYELQQSLLQVIHSCNHQQQFSYFIFEKKDPSVLLYKFSKHPMYMFIPNQFVGSADIHQK